MKNIRGRCAALLAVASLVLAACASLSTGPDAAVQRALAPTGKLRVAVYQGSPTSLVRNAATGETKGVALDLGREMSDGVPGSRVLEGRYGLESFAVGVPKGREAGLPWLREFAQQARADGTVKRAVERAGLRGTSEPESK